VNIRFHKLVAEIRAAIERGDYGSDRLFRYDLARKYRVKRHAVDRVLTALKNEGLVEVVPFKGTFVTRQPPRLVYVRAGAVNNHGSGRWKAMRSAQDGEGQTDSPTLSRVKATKDLAHRLGVAVGTELLRCTHRMLLETDLVCVQIQDSWIPSNLVGEPLAVPEDVDDWAYTVMRERGIKPTTGFEEVTARRATSEEARRLVTAAGYPVLEAWRITQDEQGRPVEARRVIADGRHVTFKYSDLGAG
jgi:DNA-binding GntR family transcriptional regulator